MATTKEQISKSILRQEALVEAAVLRIQAIVTKTINETVKGLTKAEAGTESARLLSAISDALSRNGLDEELGRLVPLYGNEIKNAIGSLQEVVDVKSLTDRVKGLATGTIELDTDAFLASINQTIGQIKSSLARGQIVGNIPEVEAPINTLANKLKTEVNTALRSFNRLVTVAQAEDLGIELFLYDGPLDERTRPFCEEHVGKAYTLEQLNELDNGQGLPVAVYLGGYNCRHELLPITAEQAKRLNAKNLN